MAKKSKSTVTKKSVKASKSNKPTKVAKAKASGKVKPAGKAAAKSQAKKNSKKSLLKKIVKPSKAVAKKHTSKKVSAAKNKAIPGKAKPTKAKPAKTSKATVKKTIKPVKKAVSKKTVKATRPGKPVKAVKPVRTKPSVKVIPVKPVAAKQKVNGKAVVKTAEKKVKTPSKKVETPVQKVITPAKKVETPKAGNPKEKSPGKVQVAAQPAKRRGKIDIAKAQAPQLNAEGLPINLVPIGKKAQQGIHATRVISAPIMQPKPTVVAAEKKKEPKGKFEMEYVVHASSNLLFEFLTTPSGLSEWFADDVNIRQGIYTFFWDGAEQQAKLVGYKDTKLARFQWEDKNDGSYFEFRVEVDDLTGDVSLIITDFAEDTAEMNASKLLWDSQVNKLLQVIGAYY